MTAYRAPSRNGFLLTVIVLALGLAIIVIAVSSLRSAGASEDPIYNDTALPVQVQTVEFVSSTTTRNQFPGLITAKRMSALAFEFGGQVKDISADIGDRVQKGSALAQLDTRILEANLAAALAQAKAMQAQAGLAEVTLNRQKNLVEQGHISAQNLDKIEADYAAAYANAAAAQASAKAFQVQIEKATLSAPFDGVITARMFDEGAIVGGGNPVLNLVESAVLEAQFGIPGDASLKLEIGDTYTISSQGVDFQARLRSVTGVINPGARTVEVVFDIPPDAPVQSGSVVRLNLEMPLNQNGFWAPLTAIAEGQRGVWAVYLLVEDEGGYILEPRPVEIIHTDKDQVYLRGALSNGSQILGTGVHRVAPGMRVRPVSGEL